MVSFVSLACTCGKNFGNKKKPTVSATDIVSLRSLRRVATSCTICRSSSGGKSGGDMILLTKEFQ